MNIGLIEGGRAVNIVPDKTKVSGEVRSHNLKKLETQTEKIVKRFKYGAEDFGAEVEVETSREFDGYNIPLEDRAIDLASKAIKAVGLKAKYAISGGGSDTNIFNKAKLKAVTLSTGMKNAHSTDERIAIDDLVKTTEILLNIVKLSTQS